MVASTAINKQLYYQIYVKYIEPLTSKTQICPVKLG